MDQLRRELGNVNRDTNTLASDVDKILKKLDNPKKADEVKTELGIIKGKLEGLAASFEPDPDVADPNDPNVTGKNEGDLKREEEADRKNEEEIKEARDKKNEAERQNTKYSEPSSLLNNKTTFSGPHQPGQAPVPSEPTPPNTFPDQFPDSPVNDPPEDAKAQSPFDPPADKNNPFGLKK